MREKMKRQRIQMVLGAVLAAFVFCVLPQHRAAAAAGIQQISMGYDHSAVLKTDGSLWMWGNNSCGQLGNGSWESSSRPVKVMTGVQSVSLGGMHSAAVKKDGSLWLWGQNYYGQLGDGSTENSNKPVKVMAGVQSVSLGEEHSAALKKDGSLWLWGWNISGQLGNGKNEDEISGNKPVKVMTGVQSVSLGDEHSAALKKDGSLWLWGSNLFGQLGSESWADSNIPVKVMTGVQSVSLGGSHSAVIKKDGSLWLWGVNGDGQLGNGNTKNSDKPVKVMTGVAQVNLGGWHSAALKKDGSLWLWGKNEYGELGNGKSGDEASGSKPVKVMTGVAQMNLGYWYSAALKKDGSLWLWGNNDHGQLGNGDSGYGKYSSKPMKITLPNSDAAKINIAKCKITLSQKNYKYTGKAIKPLPTVTYNGKTLKNKTDYTLTYKDNKKRGTATIVIKGKGSYTGQSQIKFTIKK